MSKYIVTIKGNPTAYLREGAGDPPRTLIKENAKVFNTLFSARSGIARAKKTHPFRERQYDVEEIDD